MDLDPLQLRLDHCSDAERPLELTRLLAMSVACMAAMPVGAAPLVWECGLAGTDQTLLVTVDEAAAKVKWEFKLRGKGREFTETAAFASNWVQWVFLLPATTVRMHHRLDQETGELLVTQEDSGKVRRWLCVIEQQPD